MPRKPAQDAFLADALRMRKQLVKWRRLIHQHPELAYREARTASLVAEHLRSLGLEVRTGVGGTGVVGLIRGQRLAPAVLLRADMDALPIQEAADVPYRSRIDGVMHACGHDMHTAMLMGVASLLAARADALPGSVKLCFQPAEEAGAGAVAMIRDGVLADPPIHAAVALHVHSHLPEGGIGVLTGPVTAFADSLRITIRGRSAHAAAPQEGIDSIVVAAHLITSLQSLVAREINPLRQRVISLGMIQGGTAPNIVAESVTIHGTIRSFEEPVRRRLFARVRRHARAVTQAMGATAEVELSEGYPPQVNDARLVELLGACAGSMLGSRAVRRMDDPSLGGEDFAFYGREAKVPSIMFRLGITPRGEKDPAPGHSPLFRIDDEAVAPVGTAVLARYATEVLAELAQGL